MSVQITEAATVRRSLDWRGRRWSYRYLVYYPTVFLRGQWVPRYLSHLNRSQFSSSEQIRSHQDEALLALGRWIQETVPLYRDQARPLSTQALSNLPIVTKQTLIEHRQKLRSESFRGRRFIKTTGGSTGQPVTIEKDAKALAWELAAAWRGYEWAGVSIGDPQGRLWGVPITPDARRSAILTDLLLHRRRCSAFQFTAADMDRYTNVLNDFQPSYLYGYVSMLVEYALHLRRSRTTARFRLNSVITTSEVLEPQQRAILEETFDCNVFNEYGCGEVGTIAHECERGSMHINSENVCIEVLLPDGTASSEGEGNLIVTDLLNRAMPLVRYQIGDVGRVTHKPCACGRGLPVLEKVFGRAYDTITGPDGRKFHGEFFMYMVEQAKRQGLGIEAFQVVQTDVNSLTLKIVAGAAFGPASEKFVTSYLRDRFHKDVTVDLKTVDRIERERSGKMRVVVALPR